MSGYTGRNSVTLDEQTVKGLNGIKRGGLKGRRGILL